MTFTSLKHKMFRTLSRIYGGQKAPESGLRVLLYHSVGAALPEDPYGIGIDRQTFLSHLRLLDSFKSSLHPVTFGPACSGGAQLAVTFDDGFQSILTVAAPLLVEFKIPFTLFATAEYIRNGSTLYLKPAQLKELAGLPGVHIGSHGATHRRLTELGRAELKEELADSRNYLEDLLGLPVTTFSYPHGAVNRNVRDAVEEAGYRSAGCSRYGINTPSRDPLLLCRTEVTAWDSVADLDLKIRGAWDWYRFRHKDPAQ